MQAKIDNVQIAPEAKAAFLEMLRPTAAWEYVEYVKTYPEGGELRVKAYKCNKCGFERQKRQGPSNFCEVCGARMKTEGATI